MAWSLAIAIALLTLWAYGTSRYGWKIYLEIFSHFQMQYFGLSLIFTGMVLLLRRRYPSLIVCFCCALLSAQILPWYWPPKVAFPPAADTPHVRVLIANLNTQNQSYGKALTMTRQEDPDVAVFMEVNQQWKNQLDTLGDTLPYSSARIIDTNNFGISIYSKAPLGDPQVEFFGPRNIPSIVTQISLAGQPITLLATHPLPPAKPSYFAARNQQLAEVTDYLAPVDGTVMLVGDLNTTMWSPYYSRLASKTGLHDARDGFGILPTWPTPGTYGGIPGWVLSLFQIPIDHCLVSSDLTVASIHTGADTGSDHKPVVVEVGF
ncbi:MAG: endonuclease/exonuclease/phosphatase family protein [Cyanobacteria bacterium P01_C01_bin.73]